ncbi:hypothetical protein BDW74DRAFT_178424 [Aspergillus multicolor]|uniref:phosducin family protein n=1 Tax=Aspergillus multicolor TaxID=41759 RepID=UPI003CCD1CEA
MTSAQEEFDQLIRNNREKSQAHPEDRSNLSDRDSSPEPEDHFEHSDDEDMAAMTSRTTTYTVPNTKFEANTGPKGVIADAQAFERARRSNFRKSFVSGTSAAQRHHHSASKSSGDARLLRNSPPADGSGSDLDEDEDKFLRRWRESRMQELQSKKTRRPSNRRRQYGSLETVDAVGYLDAIEKVPADQVVVVCLYDPESNTSALVEDCLHTIASRQPSVHFVKLHHEIAEMDNIEPPALLAYRGGDVFATIVHIPQQIPKGRSCSADSLEDLLRL